MNRILTLLFLLFSTISLSQALSTYAGNGTYGYDNGPAQDASFRHVEQIAIDADGNVYVADSDNHAIRKISAEGIVTTYAGTGIAGDVDGPADQAQFNFPLGVDVDANGVVYVIDNDNHKIKIIDTTGMVSTLAGNGIEGVANGPIDQAMFFHPINLCVDKNGLVYVTESSQLIRVIDPINGTVDIFAGNGITGFVNGPASSAQFNFPRGIAVDDDLNVFVSELSNNSVRKISWDGIVSTIAGDGVEGYQDGEGSQARFGGPKGITLDSIGNIYVADRLNKVIRKIDTLNNVTTIAGLPGIAGYIDGPLSEGTIGNPVGVGYLNENCIFISDWANSVIRKADFNQSSGIINEVEVQAIDIYPNPSTGFINIQGYDTENLEVFIYGRDGRLIKHKKNSIRIDISQLDAGFYLVHLLSGNQYGAGSFVKE